MLQSVLEQGKRSGMLTFMQARLQAIMMDFYSAIVSHQDSA